jgi:FKBP-type peptidyl-prolyl cis-trans isomerase
MENKTQQIVGILILVAVLGAFIFFIVGQGKKSEETKQAAQTSSSNNPSKNSSSVDNDPCKFPPLRLGAKILPTIMDNLKMLKIEDTQPGTVVKAGDQVCIHYKGTLTDGTVFDSSYPRNQPFITQIGVGQVIEGWDIGIVGLKEGGKRKLTIPPELGYRDRAQGKIPANSTLIFEVELLKVKETIQ